MSVTHYLSILFSRQRWRHALLAALLLHFGLGAYAFTQDIALGLNLSLLINTVQFALIQAALMLLYTSTSKQEGQRYSQDPRFYLKLYKDERYRMLALQRHTAGDTRALTGIPTDKCVGPALIRLASRHDLLISQSVLEWTPQRPMTISEVTFELMDEWYDLPWIVTEHGLDTILKRFNAVDRYDYNGLTLATHDWHASSDRFALRFKKSFYYNYLATNMLPEMRLPGGLTYRDLLEPGPCLSELASALPENHLGLSCLIRTRDGALILPRRSQHTTVFKEQLSPSVSGAANLATCRTPSGDYFATGLAGAGAARGTPLSGSRLGGVCPALEPVSARSRIPRHDPRATPLRQTGTVLLPASGTRCSAGHDPVERSPARR
ncbi:hypothetical protein [Halomonas alimentaria]|uniref:Uncharacterized protein n=1 Tax=Halomonas alimentaria TaxID=147248 RepID=A0A7X4W5G5_9GAMM|nr:hypothetical protein [Halomonas alimentaria]NAW34737.1 hypothetical protein [Halomonas alimentaria]